MSTTQRGTQALPWTPRTLEEWIKFAPTDYLLCWVEGHRHDEQGWSGESSTADELYGGVLLYQICDRCGVPMDKWIGPQGEVDSGHNVYYYYRMRKHPYPYIFKDKTMRSADLKGKRMLIRRELLRRGAKGYRAPQLPKEAREAGLERAGRVINFRGA